MRSMGEQVAPAFVVPSPAEESDKQKKSRRRQNRRPKQNLSVQDSICGPPPTELLENGSGVLGVCPMYQASLINASNIAFKSLPPIHIGGDMESGDVTGEVSVNSRSCPLPTSSSPIDSRDLAVAPKDAKKVFDPYWSDQFVEDAIKKGDVFKAKFRVNAHNRVEAYCTIDGLPVDVLISGDLAQNRAIEGDIVAIKLDPVACWNKMRFQNVTPNTTPEDDFKNRISMNEFVPYSNGHSTVSGKTETLEIGDQDRALERIRAMISSNPTKRPTGRVVYIIKQSNRRDTVVGFLSSKPLFPTEPGLTKNKNSTDPNRVHLVPTNPRLPKMLIGTRNLPDSVKERLKNGDENIEKELIAAKIDEWDEKSPVPQALVLSVLGRGGEIDAQIAAILFEHAMRASKFFPETLACLPEPSWEIPESELKNRKDLRNILTLTIDPSSATDLDDALSIEIVSDGVFRIGVHIADVSYFVRPDTALDIEAQIRSTSVYIIRHKLPMLPPEFSQGVASLSPGENRLALSVIWDIDSRGNILDRWIGRSVIFSCCKLSYDLVQDVINTDFDALNPYNNKSIPQVYGRFQWKDLVKSLEYFYNISMRLREMRFRDGALSLDNSKLVFLFDEEGAPCDSYRDDERKESCSLVEEFMLLANKSVAQVISSAFPDCALLRRHPKPNLKKLREFESFCGKYGLELDVSSSGRLHLSLSKIREKLQNDPMLFDILINYASKPMQSASYFCTGDLKGKKDDWAHYALSIPFYTHFTSPIRRYPDIIVHRTLYAVVEAESVYMSQGKGVLGRCFTGLRFDGEAAGSKEGREALFDAAVKFKVPGMDYLGHVAEYCNERKLACRHAEEAGEKLYLWALLKTKEVLVSEARVMGLGPRFMSVYVHKLATERRIYYEEVEGLAVDWLENTCTLLLDLHRNNKWVQKKGNPFKYRPIEDVALILSPSESSPYDENEAKEGTETEKCNLCPVVFPLVLRHLSAIPVALHAIGGDDGPLDIGVRLYTRSYFH